MPYILSVLVAVVLGVGFTLVQANQTPSAAAPAALTQGIHSTATYKDGTYKGTASYWTPSLGRYRIDVSLTIANGIVTNANTVYGNGAENDRNTNRFDRSYKSEVIGQKLNNINLSRVGGASLTTSAFNDALTSIRTQAAA
jgi:uncharacterized protein with FMN-binding domain